MKTTVVNKTKDYNVETNYKVRIPVPKYPTIVQAITARGPIVQFTGITDKIFNYVGNTQVSDEINFDRCQFTPQNIIVGYLNSNDVYFDWVVASVPSVQVLFPETPIQNNQTTFDENGNAVISLRYRVPFKQVYFFDTFNCFVSSESKFTLEEVKINFMKNDSSQEYTESSCENYSSNKTYHQENNHFFMNYTLGLKVSRCGSFFNNYVLRFKGVPGTILSLESIFLDENNYKEGLKLCPLGSYQCGTASCNPQEDSPDDGGVVAFRKGCVPNCGVCPFNNVCTTSGKCILKENKNQRSATYPLYYFLALTVLLIL
ncbi:hypothetical protein EIN_278190 [Entamoeba invadens IP1]|uniref:Uncharacterized protein n=1 Tax=Entamoeba invadens IP1 TaxID=370355 RepID=A0A0A1TVD9_ENTIV|nr:hypothetical protein EIN_278190 [Entamoeba invadens IP1]ELP84349.1 hypothetical protein EIN_278190 [Entamoeba invadens IP1]|eukprot:XP_004183695.1 hypothetical protein EIN_278190 [Entamoeba invadens IP1]